MGFPTLSSISEVSTPSPLPNLAGVLCLTYSKRNEKENESHTTSRGVRKMSKTILPEVEKLLQPILEERDLSLFDLEFVQERDENFLRVYIDKRGGVDLDECTIVSEKLSEKLDEKDFIKGAYYLEVSSPGAERALTSKQDMFDHIGENVFVSLFVHIDGEKQFEGKLLSVEDDIVTIEYKHKHTKRQVEIPYDKIAKARLAVIL